MEDTAILDYILAAMSPLSMKPTENTAEGYEHYPKILRKMPVIQRSAVTIHIYMPGIPFPQRVQVIFSPGWLKLSDRCLTRSGKG